MSLNVTNEVQIDSDPCVVAWDTTLFVGTEDGSIKSFDANLSPVASWKAHGVQVFALAAGDGKVYSTSNDGGVRIWSQDGEKVTELPASEGDIGVIRLYGKDLYIGDEVGNVIVYDGDTIKATYNLLEEVKDLGISLPYIFTVRDLYITVTEIKPDESKNRFIMRHTMEGRAPLQVSGTRLINLARGGNSLQLHEISMETGFKKLQEVKVSDLIVTSLSVCEDYAWTGGWDGCIRRWKISDDQLEVLASMDLSLHHLIGFMWERPEEGYLQSEPRKQYYYKFLCLSL